MWEPWMYIGIIGVYLSCGFLFAFPQSSKAYVQFIKNVLFMPCQFNMWNAILVSNVYVDLSFACYLCLSNLYFHVGSGKSLSRPFYSYRKSRPYLWVIEQPCILRQSGVVYIMFYLLLLYLFFQRYFLLLCSAIFEGAYHYCNLCLAA
jgi:hypothetical protein